MSSDIKTEEELNIVGQITIDLIEDENEYGFGIEKDNEHALLFTSMLDCLLRDAKEEGIQRLLHMCRIHNRNVLAREIEVFIDSLNNVVKH
jgi:hypothetical protein